MWQGVKNIYHLLVAIAANIRFSFPGRQLIVIGVTGTDGKTTTGSLIYHILNKAGLSVSLISTVNAVIHGKLYDTGFHVTNPTSFPLQKFLMLAKRIDRKPNYLVLEVTSHGLDQNRVWGIPFKVAVVTNVSHEHLDYHKTYEKYLAVKAKLLKKGEVTILNKDDLSYDLFRKILKNKKTITYAAYGDADITAQDIQLPKHFLGKHNLSNALAATAVVKQFGIPQEIINESLQSFVFPMGRGQLVYTNGFSVMVDFAHTPNAFDQLLSSLREQVKGRLIHVFGSAGERDVSKRPLMGKFASLYDDIIILTSEDPRNENPEAIVNQIQEGLQHKKNLEVIRILDREQAIKKAITLARKGDFIVITGKAHEKSMNYGKGEEPWDEFAIIDSALKKRI